MLRALFVQLIKARLTSERGITAAARFDTLSKQFIQET
jgi:hypothetical protein